MLQKLNAELIEKNLELQQKSTTMQESHYFTINYLVELVKKNTEVKENLEKENNKFLQNNMELIKRNAELNTRIEITGIIMQKIEEGLRKICQNNEELRQENKELKLMKQNTELKEFWNRFLHSP